MFGPSRPEFVYPGCWHFDNSATSKFDDVLLEHGGIPHVLPLAVHLNFFFLNKSFYCHPQSPWYYSRGSINWAKSLEVIYPTIKQKFISILVPNEIKFLKKVQDVNF